MNPKLLALASNLDVNKIIKYVIILIVVLIAIRYIKKYVKKHKNEQVVANLEQDIKVNKLSYPLSYYPLWADELFKAMDGMGTNEDVVFKIFGKLKTKDDVLQLITAFGVKKEETLTQWLVDDLSDDDRNALNRLMSDKNINYQF